MNTLYSDCKSNKKSSNHEETNSIIIVMQFFLTYLVKSSIVIS